ncbi:MAG TPA: pectinesterase family protein [Acidobacteriaceae bacterium]
MKTGFVAAVVLAVSSAAFAQQPLPYTITTVAGGVATVAAGTATAPVACAPGSPYNSYDAFGDGCPGLLARFSADLRGGIASDGQGNIYIADTSNSLVRKYDPKTGIVSRVAGGGTACTTANGALDSSGDGCPALQTKFPANPRGVGVDAYGNVLIAGYGSQMIQIVCNALSPLCPGTAGRKQVGSMYRIAGCVATVGGAATGSPTTNTVLDTWAGTEGDNSFASPFSNLSGDATAGITGTAVGGTCPAVSTGTTVASVASINQPRGVAGDKYGNVYIAETATAGAGLRFRVVLGPLTSTYFTGNNPLWAIVNGAVNFTSTAGTFTYTAHEGYIYTILGGFTGAPSAGGACGAYVAEDAKGDGCPFYYSTANAGQQGVAVDDSGNVYFSDIANDLIRVLYAGGTNNPIVNAIAVNSGTGAAAVTTPVAGNVYLLAGGGTSGASATPALGSLTAFSNTIDRLTVGPGGNLYIGDTNGSAVDFYDINTGYVRQLFKSGTPCTAHVVGSANGDGCPVNTFSVSGAAAFGVAVDPLGNLYLGDSESSSLIRKVEAVSLVPTIVGSQTAASTTYTQTLQFHGPVNTASMTVTALNAAPDITLGTPTCAAANADLTADCTVVVTYAPTQPGTRTMNLSVTTLDGSSNLLSNQVFPVSGVANGTALVADIPSPGTAGSPSGVPVGVALDGAGNRYYVDTNSGNVIKFNNATSATTVVGVAPSNPLQVAVDTAGNVYVTSSGSSTLANYNLQPDGSYKTKTGGNPNVLLPQAIAIDQSGNVFVADKMTGSVYEAPAGTAFNTVQPFQTIATGLSNPVGLSFDGLGNLLIADQGAPGVYRVTNVNGINTQTLYAASAGSPTITIAGLVPVAVAGDAAGNVYVADSTSKSVIAIPVSQAGPATTLVLGGLTTPSGVAVDGNGVVYVADSGTGFVTQVNRNEASFDFLVNTTEIFGATYTNAGNINATGFQVAGQDSAEFPITSVSPANCFATAAITPGYACSFTSQFTPTSGTGPVTSTLAYTPATSTTGSLRLAGTKNGAAVTTTTTIGTQSPAGPVYSTVGTEVTFPVTVTASDSSTPSGFVNVTIDALAPVAYNLTAGAISIPVSGLVAGNHAITVAYPTQNGITGSTSSTVNFTIAQATTSINWTPGTTTQQFSAAVGPGVLNAAAVTGGSTPVPGAFVYTATPSGGAAVAIHSASYLPIGTYALNVAFVPNDSVNFIGSAASVATYTVTQATTTAALGATQMLVAADGTGNFASVQAAVNTLPGGGSIYIKPGTYSGNIAVVQPNIALRGLGGDPTQVVLTHSGGAFNNGQVQNQFAGEFNQSQSNGSQLPAGSTVFTGDEASATLIVAKGINTAVSGSTLIPNNFYGENFSLINTYNTDTTTTTNVYTGGGATPCVVNSGAARTYSDLFNSGLECASQALAIWTTSDLSVMNNVYTASLQDTIYTASQGNGIAARQYWFRGKVTGTVDYIFGDAAAVFDSTSIYTAWHGNTATGTETIHAQNKSAQTGSVGDYLSGYVMNNDVFTSQSPGMTSLYFGRPYGTYSTWIMLNSYVDQVNPTGYTTGLGPTLTPVTFSEYNDIPYTDPVPNALDLNGIPYVGAGGSSGAGVAGPREANSTNPGTPMANDNPPTAMTQAQAQAYFPGNFLSQPVSGSPKVSWSPTAAIAANANAFVPSGTTATVAGGSSVTILMRPQTPGLGAISNGIYTIPTGTYTLTDTYNGGNPTVIASGSLDASGEAYFTSSNLADGTHNLSWTYSGDSNFAGSTTASAYVLTVTGPAASTTTTTLVVPQSDSVHYGSAAPVAVQVASSGGTPTGTATLTVNGTQTLTATLNSGSATFIIPGLTAGTYSLTASYAGSPTFIPSTTASPSPLVVNPFPLTVTAACANRSFGQLNSCSATVTGGYQYSDSAATVFTATPTATTTATRYSPASTFGAYGATPVYTLTAFGNTNYVVTAVPGFFTVTGNTNLPQAIIFAPLPPLASGGTYQLTARTTSGLPVSYTLTQTNGNANISGSTLNVIGPGIFFVQAAQTDPTGDYAPAAPVTRVFIVH